MQKFQNMSSVLTIVTLYVTLKQVNFFHSFSRSNSEKLIGTLFLYISFDKFQF